MIVTKESTKSFLIDKDIFVLRLQAGPQLILGFSENLDSDCPIVLIYHDQLYMKNFPNQPELNNPLGTVFTFYTKGVHSLASCGWFLKKSLLIKVGDVY